MNDTMNKTMAEFMGAKPFRESVSEDIYSYEMYGVIESIDDGVDEKHFFLPSEMKFHISWDWLVPVVQKIEMDCQGVPVQLLNLSLYSEMVEVYDAVVDFIEHNAEALKGGYLHA